MEKEFTASAYILHEQKILLLFHHKFQKWLPPGGHVEANETPAETAKREAKEETGLDIEFIKQENIWLNYWNAVSFDRPYFCLLGNIPAYKDRPAHQHMDFVYIAKPIKLITEMPENCRWFKRTELQTLKPDVEIFQETLDVIDHLDAKFFNK